MSSETWGQAFERGLTVEEAKRYTTLFMKSKDIEHQVPKDKICRDLWFIAFNIRWSGKMPLHKLLSERAKSGNWANMVCFLEPEDVMQYVDVSKDMARDYIKVLRKLMG